MRRGPGGRGQRRGTTRHQGVKGRDVNFMRLDLVFSLSLNSNIKSQKLTSDFSGQDPEAAPASDLSFQVRARVEFKLVLISSLIVKISSWGLVLVPACCKVWAVECVLAAGNFWTYQHSLASSNMLVRPGPATFYSYDWDERNKHCEPHTNTL